MIKLDKKKKAFILLSTYLIILTTPKVKSQTYDISINEEYKIYSSEPYARYSDGNIYIGKKSYIDKIRDDTTNDIYIIDDRNNINPNMSICNSYEIRDNKLKSNILDVLLEYEKEYPSRWNRTKSSMLLEWIAHNYCYNLTFRTQSTQHVDLDNKDEKKYSLLLPKMLK